MPPEQIEFGTYEQGTASLQSAYATLAETYNPENLDALAAFSLPDEMVDITSSEDQLPGPSPIAERGWGEVSPTASPTLQPSARREGVNLDYRRALQLFPHPQLARRIFGTLENCRIDRRLRAKYRGLARDLDLIREHLRRRASRP